MQLSSTACSILLKVQLALKPYSFWKQHAALLAAAG
jgi:hypothetical protein